MSHVSFPEPREPLASCVNIFFFGEEKLEKRLALELEGLPYAEKT